MKCTLSLAALVVGGLAVVAGLPAQTRSAPRTSISITGGLVTAIDDIEVPTRDQGPLAEIEVTRGKEVEEGELLGKIDDIDAQLKADAAEAELEAAKEQASSTAEITAAKHTAGAAEAEYQQSKKIRERNPDAISETQLRRDLLQYQRAVAQIAVAETEHKMHGKTVLVKQAQLKVAQNEVLKRQFRAPAAGVIVDIRKDIGEWVQPGEAVFRIVRMDKLRVEGFVNASEVQQDEVRGRNVRVIVHQPRGEKYELVGRVDFASPVIEANGEFRIFCDVKNQQVDGNWLVSPGARADLTIELGRAATPVNANFRGPNR